MLRSRLVDVEVDHEPLLLKCTKSKVGNTSSGEPVESVTTQALFDIAFLPFRLNTPCDIQSTYCSRSLVSNKPATYTLQGVAHWVTVLLQIYAYLFGPYLSAVSFCYRSSPYLSPLPRPTTMQLVASTQSGLRSVFGSRCSNATNRMITKPVDGQKRLVPVRGMPRTSMRVPRVQVRSCCQCTASTAPIRFYNA